MYDWRADGWRHWTVEDGAFTDRWEWDDDLGRFGWVDRVVEDGRARYEVVNRGRPVAVCDGFDEAMAAARIEVMYG